MTSGKRRSCRAIYLISTLFATILILMFLGAAIALAPAGFGRATQDAAAASAQRAARSGVEWAVARMRSNPSWLAQGTSPFAPMPGGNPDLTVTEQQGQVTGWVREGARWSRFRIRFNWQDGGPLSSTDNLGDPTTFWSDFNLVSCNNLLGAYPKMIPNTSSNGNVPSPISGATTRMTLPNNSALLSVEGASGPVNQSGSNPPSGFSGLVSTRTVEAIVRVNGTGETLTDAASMSAGDLGVILANSDLTLADLLAEVTTMRSKSSLSVLNTTPSTAAVTSLKGQLQAPAGTINANNGTNVTEPVEHSSDGFYVITSSMVKQPGASHDSVVAGIYVVGRSGGVTYYDMSYNAYQQARIDGTLSGGSPATLPASWTKALGGNPSVQFTISNDVQVTPTATSSDFGFVPDGGAPASTDTGITSSAAAADVAAAFAVGGPMSSYLSIPAALGPVGSWSVPDDFNMLKNLSRHVTLSKVGGVSTATWVNPSPPGGWLSVTDSGFYSQGPLSSLDAGVFMADLSNSILAGSPNPRLVIESFNKLCMSTLDPNKVSIAPIPLLPPDAPTVAQLPPSGLQVTFLSPSGSTVFANAGNITFGSQVIGYGAAIVSNSNINLIGTSTDLSSTPGIALGLNLYAQGNIKIDPFNLDHVLPATFHAVGIQGVLYSWGNTSITVGNPDFPMSSWGNFTLQGAMVSYGGNPSAGLPSMGAAYNGTTNITAMSSNVEFDPSYLVNLRQNPPIPLPTKVSSWYEH